MRMGSTSRLIFFLGLVGAIGVWSAPRPAASCSTFLIETAAGSLVGKGYDWRDEHALALINKSGVAKQALVVDPRDPPAHWTSRHASLSFNQYGREFPNGGINDAGLVVEVLVLEDSVFAKADGRPVVSELQFVQYLLDQAATLDEAVTLAKAIRVVPVFAPLHYFVCDASPACGAFEYLGGKLVVSRGDDLPAKVLTNSTYRASRGALTASGTLVPTGQGSRDRFVRLAHGVATYSADRAADTGDAFSMLDSVRFADSTRWQIVYEQGNLRAYFRSRSHPTIKSINLPTFDPNCTTPAMMYDPLTDDTGDVTARFVPYDAATNARLLQASFGALNDKRVLSLSKQVAGYAEGTSCSLRE